MEIVPLNVTQYWKLTTTIATQWDLQRAPWRGPAGVYILRWGIDVRTLLNGHLRDWQPIQAARPLLTNSETF